MPRWACTLRTPASWCTRTVASTQTRCSATAAAARAPSLPPWTSAASAKLVASELAVHAADLAMQVHGGYGFMEESAIPRFYRDAKILTIGEGTSEILKLVIARQMGLNV